MTHWSVTLQHSVKQPRQALPQDFFTAEAALPHFLELTTSAMNLAKLLSKGKVLQTPYKEVKLYFIANDDQVVEAIHVGDANIPDTISISSILFVPRGQSMADLPKGQVREKYNSKAYHTC